MLLLVKFFRAQSRSAEWLRQLAGRDLHDDSIMGTGRDADVAAIAHGRVNVGRLIPLEAQHSTSPAGGDHWAAGAGLAEIIVDYRCGPAGRG